MGFWDWIWPKNDDGDRPAVAVLRAPAAAPPARALPAKEVVPSPPVPTLSIEGAIRLMRALPLDEDPDLVMSVVRKTLRSTGLSVEGIVGAAKDQEDALSASIAKDGAAIEQLELEIVARRTSIERTKKQLGETREVRERLQEAIQNESRVGPSLVAPAEIARLQAEAAASKPPPAVAPKPSAPPVPKTGAPPVPKTGAPPPVPKKSFAPKLQGSMPPHSPKPSAPAPASATAGAQVPSLSDDADVHSEETARVLSSAPGGGSSPER